MRARAGGAARRCARRRRERVLDRIQHGRRRYNHAALADAAEADVGVERHGLRVLDLDPGDVAGRRQQVVHERGRLVVAVLLAGRSLEGHSADALRDSAPDLALDDRGIDDRAAVLGRDIPLDLQDSGLDVHLDDGAVAAAWPPSNTFDFEDGIDVGTERPDAACRATSATGIALSGSPQTTTWPSVISRSRALASMSGAATSRTLAFSCRAPYRVTPPVMVAHRLPPVGPKGTASLSPMSLPGPRGQPRPDHR